jgi:hypothetical protein
MAVSTQTFNEILSTLESVPFPATKTDVVNAARRNGASRELQKACQNLSDSQNFKSPQDVINSLRLK